MAKSESHAPRIQKQYLLLIAGVVWCFAGSMILSIGLPAYAESWPFPWYGPVLSAVIFSLFFFLIFLRMFRRHRARILGYEKERVCVFAFFDRKSWIIMVCMITFGILLRSSGLLRPFWLGMLYTGIGGALAGAGVCFLAAFFTALAERAEVRR